MTRAIRPLSLSEVERLVDWAGAEGWNPGVGDAQAFHAADPDGFLGVFHDEELVAGVAAVAYDSAFGFIGLYLCRVDRRGEGFGRAVWDAGMDRLGSRVIGLDGVPAQQANYRAMGFTVAHRTLRFTGRPEFNEPDRGGWSVEPFEPGHRLAVLRFDREVFPADRERFLEAWLTAPRHAVVATRAGAFGGFGAVRRCREGCKVGPLFAADGDAALAILRALARAAGGEVSIDVPEGQESFSGKLAASAMRPSFQTARMYKGEKPILRLARVYGLTTLELG